MNATDAEKLRELMNSTTFAWLGLVVALFVLAAVVHRIRAWYRDGDDPADANDEIVQQLEELNRRGDLSDEEIRSIKSEISRRKQG